MCVHERGVGWCVPALLEADDTVDCLEMFLTFYDNS